MAAESTATACSAATSTSMAAATSAAMSSTTALPISCGDQTKGAQSREKHEFRESHNNTFTQLDVLVPNWVPVYRNRNSLGPQGAWMAKSVL